MEEFKDHQHRDPLTDEPGAHPLGVVLGAAAGGVAAGALVGTASAGPVGAVVGAAVGAVAGGLGGKAIAEHFDPTIVDTHWRARFESEPYRAPGTEYGDYAPAYRLGSEWRQRYAGKEFEEVEPDLAATYDTIRGPSKLDWDQVQPAVKAAWYHVYNE